VTSANPRVGGQSVPALQPEAAAPLPELCQLFDAHADFVYRVLLRLGVPRADAEDCVQDVFLVVAHRLSDYEERGSIRAWLFMIARQVAMHAQRSSVRRARYHLEIVPPAQTDDPHRILVRKQAIELVHEFLAELDEPQAQAFYLAEIEQLSMPEIAAALGVKLNTAYSRLRLARRRLEQWLATRSQDAP
jgi:RNA polymerase sigma-70 factor, ECF subfamily